MSDIEEFKQKWKSDLYLGDGVYIHFDGYHLVLNTEHTNGKSEISLEPEVFKNLVGYASGLDDDIQKLDSSYNRRFTDDVKKP